MCRCKSKKINHARDIGKAAKGHVGSPAQPREPLRPQQVAKVDDKETTERIHTHQIHTKEIGD